MLHIDSLVMTDIGMYTCVAITTGSVGSTDTAEAYLTVVGKCNLTILFCRASLSSPPRLHLDRCLPKSKIKEVDSAAGIKGKLYFACVLRLSLKVEPTIRVHFPSKELPA